MPLRDHFRPPVDDRHSWDELHGLWPATMVQHLAKQLPPDYYAAPLIRPGGIDEYEVRVYDVRRERRLVAVIELVSPTNKDRPETRQAFLNKCAALLRQDVSVTIIDVVTTRDFNLYAELLALLEQTDLTVADPPSSTYTATCRFTKPGKRKLFEAWHVPLAVGQALPSLPIWLTETLAVSVDLETTYEETCRVLRIA